MSEDLNPRDEKNLSESIKMAAAAKMPLLVSGAGSKSRIGPIAAQPGWVL